MLNEYVLEIPVQTTECLTDPPKAAGKSYQRCCEQQERRKQTRDANWWSVLEASSSGLERTQGQCDLELQEWAHRPSVKD